MIKLTDWKKFLPWYLGLLIGACTPIEDCQLDPNSSSMYVSFDHNTVTSFSFDSVKNNLSATVYYDADTSFSSIPVPLSSNSNDIRYDFFTDSTDYFVEIRYSTQPNVYGEDCPISIYYSQLEIGDYNFDTVIVTNSFLDRRITQNIEVSF